MHTLIHSARLVTEDGPADAWVLFDGETIAATGRGAPPEVDAEIVDAAGRWLSPGFIDLHVHGGGGVAFDDGADAIRDGLILHRAHGTTRSIVSLVTASIPNLEYRIAEAVAVAETDPLVLGIHLEGPFLSSTHQGAHDPELLRAPDPESIDRLLEAGRGHIRQITIAPELPGGMDAIQRLVEAGVVAAVGHSNADYETALAAFDAGATILTHAFNGMNGIHHRAPGPVVAAMHASHVTLELINDGEHVHSEVARLAFAGAPGRIALITDAMAAAGAPDGDYRIGDLEVIVADGVARLRSTGSHAGSTLTLDRALRQAVGPVGLPLATAVQALTETPARAIGRPDLGRLVPGSPADALLLDEELEIAAVWAAGTRLS